MSARDEQAIARAFRELRALIDKHEAALTPAESPKVEEVEPDLLAEGFVIWSGEHGAYWREGGHGYTTAFLGAGVYSREEAERRIGGSGPEKRIEIRPISRDLGAMNLRGSVAELLLQRAIRAAPAPPGTAAPVRTEEEKRSGEFFDVVFDDGPGPEGGRFVEVEDPEGRSTTVGEWVKRADGYWALRIPRPFLPWRGSAKLVPVAWRWRFKSVGGPEPWNTGNEQPCFDYPELWETEPLYATPTPAAAPETAETQGGEGEPCATCGHDRSIHHPSGDCHYNRLVSPALELPTCDCDEFVTPSPSTGADEGERIEGFTHGGTRTTYTDQHGQYVSYMVMTRRMPGYEQPCTLLIHAPPREPVGLLSMLPCCPHEGRHHDVSGRCQVPGCRCAGWYAGIGREPVETAEREPRTAEGGEDTASDNRGPVVSGVGQEDRSAPGVCKNCGHPRGSHAGDTTCLERVAGPGYKGTGFCPCIEYVPAAPAPTSASGEEHRLAGGPLVDVEAAKYWRAANATPSPSQPAGTTEGSGVAVDVLEEIERRLKRLRRTGASWAEIQGLVTDAVAEARKIRAQRDELLGRVDFLEGEIRALEDGTGLPNVIAQTEARVWAEVEGRVAAGEREAFEAGFSDGRTLENWMVYRQHEGNGMSANDGGQAFPSVGEGFGNPQYSAPGMTLRDYFAGQVIVALLLAPHQMGDEARQNEQKAAAWAHNQADAMLAAREPQP